MRSLAVVLVFLGFTAATTAGAFELIIDGDFQTPPPTPWEEIQPGGAHADSYYPGDTLGEYCGLTDVSVRGTYSTLEAQLRQFTQPWPVFAVPQICWDMWYMPGESGQVANFSVTVVAEDSTHRMWDTLLYQYGKIGLRQPRPHLGVINLDTGSAGQWHTVTRDFSKDWHQAGLDVNYYVSQLTLQSNGLDHQGVWFGQRVRWDNVDMSLIYPAVEQPSHPTRPSTLLVWPTVARGPIRYESRTPVSVYDASGRRVTVLPPGSGKASLPSGGVFFLRSGGSAAKLTML